MEKHTVGRTGRRPLRIYGQLLGRATSHDYTGRRQNVWTDVALYRAARSGTFVLAVANHNQWQGAPQTSAALVADTPEMLIEEAALHDNPDVAELLLEVCGAAGLDVAEALE